MSKPKRQHYVPQWYQRKFADTSGYLWVFDKTTKCYQRMNPRNFLVVKHHFTPKYGNPKLNPYGFEKFLAKEYDSKMCSILEKIEKSEQLNEDEVSSLVVFIAMQRIFAPVNVDSVMRILRDHSQRCSLAMGKEVSPIDLLRANFDEDDFRFLFWATNFKKIADYIIFMRLEVFSFECDVSLMFNDNPVLFINDLYDLPGWYQPGLAEAGTHVFYAISKDRILMLSHPSLHEADPPRHDEIVEYDENSPVWGSHILYSQAGSDLAVSWNRLSYKYGDRWLASGDEGELRSLVTDYNEN